MKLAAGAVGIWLQVEVQDLGLGVRFEAFRLLKAQD